jgi:hypothetical protein
MQFWQLPALSFTSAPYLPSFPITVVASTNDSFCQRNPPFVDFLVAKDVLSPGLAFCEQFFANFTIFRIRKIQFIISTGTIMIVLDVPFYWVKAAVVHAELVKGPVKHARLQSFHNLDCGHKKKIQAK